MADECVNRFEYERILLGQQDKYWASFQHEVGSVANEREFGRIWRYAITEILGWTWQEAVKYLNSDIVKAIKLNSTFYAINYDIKHHFIGDFKSAIQLAFPEEKIYDFATETIAEYKKVAKKDDWANDPRPLKYNKKFFLDYNGADRAKIIMRWLLRRCCSEFTPVELYEMFANKEHATAFIEAHCLKTPCQLLYSNDAYEFFHDSYDKSSDYLYYLGQINASVKKQMAG